ncbi:MAG: hypothetical protein COT71_03760 [Candidatus Andersenbacteria bacterium CG10_big_fil_rev_8_21_14_0_10_54_11]|uniref:Undecaprenyl-phosphate alpha-N-acetylglucosaminyl 1-phosphate transferase n=1 Tax=Candidatus Andersenbacteria bacterium CG10_big_fil_rev_8_21_14_0_10_54_11 TaxID=1974485 RepID=A0A2M6WYJ5_9BACT|nr:MAG: hypothetical protein COT71_03760 [Candidatus Andersenbacteria bacterium CG10_big_fil_rev_8_21_14_0_10_54_11]
MLDLTPLQPRHAFLFLVVFTAAVAGPRLRLPFLTAPAPRARVRYAGGVLAAISAISASAVVSLPLAVGLVAAALLTGIIGRWDERHPLPPSVQLAWQLLIAAILVVAGWSIQYVSHPIGQGTISLNWLQLGPIALPAAGITVIWLTLLMNAMNWLDGTDGLAPGVAAAALFVLAAVSLLPQIQSGPMLTLAVSGLAATIGFSWWNWPPAKIFLGTSGSWFLGWYIGLVGLTGGGKIITTALILAWPVLDALAVATQRLQTGQPLWRGDRHSHLHYRLRAGGISAANIALLAISVTLLAGLVALLLPTAAKIALLSAVAAVFSLASLKTPPSASRKRTLKK